MSGLAIIILTYNERLHIVRAIGSIKDFAAEIFVIDSYSTDDTVEIAKTHGATVLQNAFVNYAKQFQWALENAPITSTWIMRLDADEVVEPDLAAEIAAELPKLPAEVAGVNLQRKHIFLGRWIRYGGRYPLTLMRIWRRGQGRIEDRWMDEHIVVWSGGTITFKGGFADHNLNDLTFFIDKHNKYATREEIDVLNQKYGFLSRDEALSTESASRQAAIKRYLKEHFYNRLPFWVAASGYFSYRYVVQLGFLDGIEALIYHFLHGFWYRFLVGAKVLEFERALKAINDVEAKRAALSRITGYNLDPIQPSE